MAMKPKEEVEKMTTKQRNEGERGRERERERCSWIFEKEIVEKCEKKSVCVRAVAV